MQTELLYKKAIELAGLTGKERVIDAYCGIGTIGLIASEKAGEVIGVELNRDAVRDAVTNARQQSGKKYPLLLRRCRPVYGRHGGSREKKQM